MTTIPNPPSIAIIGAGPAGLLLARYLQQHSISCTVYERDASRLSRTQGGSLDLHAESGLLALTEAGLIDKFRQFSRAEGDQMRILDSEGKVWFDSLVDEEAFRGPPGEEDAHVRPEIDRSVSIVLPKPF
jgi:2-polyprenyl-6-methoxyphenol hydroxylase-like FAD-dependent oxidoreductase